MYLSLKRFEGLLETSKSGLLARPCVDHLTGTKFILCYTCQTAAAVRRDLPKYQYCRPSRRVQQERDVGMTPTEKPVWDAMKNVEQSRDV